MVQHVDHQTSINQRPKKYQQRSRFKCGSPCPSVPPGHADDNQANNHDGPKYSPDDRSQRNGSSAATSDKKSDHTGQGRSDHRRQKNPPGFSVAQ